MEAPQQLWEFSNETTADHLASAKQHLSLRAVVGGPPVTMFGDPSSEQDLKLKIVSLID